ncbi:MAG TPA: asparagine synthase (glutamine-hydrolyzing) [Terriglobia bacterium]|nr:asparagine synthase (glutamine-hydrolyzing) [Terriglobia bacterium]
MCGICGAVILNSGSQPPDGLRAALEAMNQEIRHRGPDDDGFFVTERVGLAMRRLSIIDLQTGHQPISNEDGSIWLVFNGEIYNHQELRPGLEKQGHHYRTHSDTETIVHLYEQYGKDCVRRLRGMFAFALWDSRRQVYFAARDRLGIKPFYYRLTPETFLFGSEIKTILAYPGVRAELNRTAIPEYLAFGFVAGPETLFAGIHKLPPGHTLQIDPSGKVQIESYWDVPQAERQGDQPRSYYVRTYRELLEQSVSSHLMSDVPLGVFLSGGLDSSVVAALMTKIRKAPIETFSVGYEEAPYSELPYARAVAKHLNSVHHEVTVSWQQFWACLPKLIWHEDEPIVWPSSIPLYYCAQLAREHVKVVLTGEGSDETLGGYTRYPLTVWNARLDRMYRALTPGALRRMVRGFLNDSNLLGVGLKRKSSHTFLARDGDSWRSLYLDNFFSAFSQADQELLLDDRLAAECGSIPDAVYGGVLKYWEQSSGDLLQRLLYTDIKTYMVELLMKQDNMSMAASIESRVPFLDHFLVEFTAKIPSKFQTKGLAGKCILKSAAEDLLPEPIIFRRKMGFPTPWRGWLAGPQLNSIENLLLEPRTLERQLFKPEQLRRLFADHRQGSADHYDRIWRLLNLEIWSRVFLDRDASLFDHSTVGSSLVAGNSGTA